MRGAKPLASALYVGQVGHVRTRPRRHALSYRVFMLLIDLDELAHFSRRLRLFRVARFGLVSFWPRDHGDGSDTPLRDQIEAQLDAAGLGTGGGPIRLLCLPRILGYVFNPISVYFCHERDGRLRAILYEVSSTFGERHSYLVSASEDASGLIRQSVDKRLHVSPFLDMQLRYDFAVRAPGERVRVAIQAHDDAGVILSAQFTGDRRSLDNATLLAAWVGHPLLTLKVVGAIHWEAAKLWLKGVRLRAGPEAPGTPVTLGRVRAPAVRPRT